MKAIIDTLQGRSSDGEIVNLYPRTLIECISNKNGEKLEDMMHYTVTNENLLSNGYFKDPINTSGKTEWTSGNTIDCWSVGNASLSTISLVDTGLKLANSWTTEANKVVFQTENPVTLKNGTYTLSIKVVEMVGVWYHDFGSNFKLTTGVNTTTVTFDDDVERIIRIFKNSAETDAYIVIEWIKLENGSATPFIIPNKNIEKLKCGVIESDVTMLPKTLNTSILEKALELPVGIYHYFMGGDNYTGTDLPRSGYNYGTATINKRNTLAINVILWGSEGLALVPVQTFYNRNTSTFDNWVAFNDGGNADTVDGHHAGSLLKAKGDNPTSVVMNQACRITNSDSRFPANYGMYVAMGSNEDGNTGKYMMHLYLANDESLYVQWTNDSVEITSDGWAKLAKSSDLTNYLPLTGGKTIGDGTTYKPLSIKGNSNKYAQIPFMDSNSGSLGSFGFTGQNNPSFINTDGVPNNIFHAGNKPTGTYTGNGSAETRTISTDSIGHVFIIREKGSINFAIVTTSGYIAKQGSNIVTGNDVTESYGSINIKTSSALFNTSGTIYEYIAL